MPSLVCVVVLGKSQWLFIKLSTHLYPFYVTSLTIYELCLSREAIHSTVCSDDLLFLSCTASFLSSLVLLFRFYYFSLYFFLSFLFFLSLRMRGAIKPRPFKLRTFRRSADIPSLDLPVLIRPSGRFFIREAKRKTTLAMKKDDGEKKTRGKKGGKRTKKGKQNRQNQKETGFSLTLFLSFYKCVCVCLGGMN